MSYETIASICKIISLLMFFPLFCGFAFWAYHRKNKERFDSYALIPLQED